MPRRPRPGAGAGTRPGGPARPRTGARTATAVAATVTVSALAIGTGLGLDRLVLPELRSEQTASARQASHGPGIGPPGGQSDMGSTDSGKGTADGAVPAASGRSTTQRPARPSAHPSAQASQTARPPAKDVPPSEPGGISGGDAEAAVTAITNAARIKAGCKPLRPDPRLVAAARAHSSDMLAHGYFDHTSRNGDSPWKRMEKAGYPSPGAENIAKGYPTAETVVASWMKSSGHRANILNCGLRAIGVGMAAGSGGPLWTQDFGWK